MTASADMLRDLWEARELLQQVAVVRDKDGEEVCALCDCDILIDNHENGCALAAFLANIPAAPAAIPATLDDADRSNTVSASEGAGDGEPSLDILFSRLVDLGVTPEQARRGMIEAHRRAGAERGDPRCTSVAPKGSAVNEGRRCDLAAGHGCRHEVINQHGGWTSRSFWRDDR